MQKTYSPLVSIIVPFYNPGDLLEQTLECVFRQTYPHWECLLVNDGSQDHSLEIAQKWEQKDARFNVFDKANTGVADSRNVGLENAKGEFLMFLDADDIMEPKRIESSIKDFDEDPDLEVSFFNYVLLKEGKMEPHKFKFSEVDFRYILRDWDVKYTFPMHCIVFKKELAKDFRFHTDLKAKVDWDLWGHLFLSEPKTRIHTEILSAYRLHENVITGDKTRMFENDQKITRYFLNTLPEEKRELVLERVYLLLGNERFQRKRLLASDSYKLGNRIVRFLKFFR